MLRSVVPERDLVDRARDANRFLHELAGRANASAALDEPWFMQLGLMVGEGWDVRPPEERRG